MAMTLVKGTVTIHADAQDATRPDASMMALACLAREWGDEKRVPKGLEATWALRFSRLRENILAWYDLGGCSTVLELGCGCGAVTGLLLRQAERVVAVARDRAEAEVCAERYRDATNLELWAGLRDEAVAEVAPEADCIIIHDLVRADESLLAQVARLMRPEARLLVTVRNELGYRELASARLDEAGPLDVKSRAAATPLFSKSKLTRALSKAGLAEQRFWYPFPDHYFTRYVFSDERPPKHGEISLHADATLAPRCMAHSEDSIAQAFAREGAFGLVSASFFVEARRQPAPCEQPIYAKVSNERRPELAIATTIGRDQTVRKLPLYEAGAAHVAHVADAYHALLKQHEGHFVPGAVRLEEAGALRLDFVDGHTLESALIDAMEAGHDDEVRATLAAYRDAVMATADQPFAVTDEFLQLFGGHASAEALAAYEGEPSQAVTDVDLIMSNIIPVGDAWTLIDYEWTFDFPIPAKYVLWRALFYLLYSRTAQRHEQEYQLYPSWGITDADRDTFFKMEVSLQQYLTGDLDAIDTALMNANPDTCMVYDLVDERDRLRRELDEARERLAQAQSQKPPREPKGPGLLGALRRRK